MKFFTDLSWWWLPVIITCSFVLTYFFYKKKEWHRSISHKLWLLLFSIRFLSLLFIGILLLGFLLEKPSYQKKDPIISVLIDNSSSMLNYSDSVEVINTIQNWLNTFQEQTIGKYEVAAFDFDTQLLPEDTINFNFQVSPLSSRMDELFNRFYGKNLGAFVVLSDGNFNKGANPIYQLENYKNIPIYAVGVGDTVQKKDQLIANVNHNPIAFLGNEFPIQVDVEGFLMGGASTELTVYDGEKVITKKKIQFDTSEYQLKTINFSIEAKSVGVKSYMLRLSAIENEANLDNNEKTMYIEVLDSRSKILLLGSTPHPDLGAIKRALDKDKNLEVETALTDDLPRNLSVFDLIIWHEPNVNLTKKIANQLIASQKPIWYFLGPRTSNSTVKMLELPLMIDTRGQKDQVQASINHSFNAFELDESIVEGAKNWPPILVNYGKIKFLQPVKIVLNQRLGKVTKEEPVLFLGEKSNDKYAVFYGEGLWKWRINEFARTANYDGVDGLINKVVQYLVIRSNTSRLRVKAPTSAFETEEISFKASFYNENFETIVDPTISFKLMDEDDNETNYEFLPQTNDYVLKVGYLPSGTYTWKASTSYNGEEFSKNGSFVVKKLEVEALDTKANHKLLYQLANQSSGQFYSLNNINDLLPALESRKDIAPISYSSVLYHKLIDFKWIFFVIVFLLSLEWFLRRYYGAY